MFLRCRFHPPRSLLIAKVDAAKEAGKLLADMPRLWAGAYPQERHQLLTTILAAVYIDWKDSRSIISVKAEPAFRALPGLAVSAGEPFSDSDTEITMLDDQFKTEIVHR